MWIPTYDLVNIDGEATGQRFGIRIYHDGQIEMLHRLSGKFKASFNFVVNILLYKFDLVARRFGDAVQAEFYRYVNWAMPALILIGSVVIMLYAMV